VSFLLEGETKTVHNKEKLKEFATTKPAQQKILKGLLHIAETRVRQINPFEQPDQQTRKTKQKGNKGVWKQQAPLNINTKCKWPQCPSEET
jgi:hypothetical protein